MQVAPCVRTPAAPHRIDNQQLGLKGQKPTPSTNAGIVGSPQTGGDVSLNGGGALLRSSLWVIREIQATKAGLRGVQLRLEEAGKGKGEDEG